MLCRAFNIAQSLVEDLEMELQTSLTSSEQFTEQLLIDSFWHGLKQSIGSWLPFSSKPLAAESVKRAVRHDLVLLSVHVWHYSSLQVPAKLPHRLSGSCL